MKMRVYAYKNCDTCRRALKWLGARDIAHEVVPIREQPPTLQELRRMLSITGDIRRLFNTSGGDYKAMGLKDRVGEMKEADALALLAGNGNLVKRPFVLTTTSGTTGFKEEEWGRLFA